VDVEMPSAILSITSASHTIDWVQNEHDLSRTLVTSARSTSDPAAEFELFVKTEKPNEPTSIIEIFNDELRLGEKKEQQEEQKEEVAPLTTAVRPDPFYEISIGPQPGTPR